MRRIFWMGVGVTVTILVIRKGRKIAEQIRPDAIAKRAVRSLESQADNLVARVSKGVRGFGGDLREGMNERERALRSALLSEGQEDPQDVRLRRADMNWPNRDGTRSDWARGDWESEDVGARRGDRHGDGDFPGRNPRLDDDEMPYKF